MKKMTYADVASEITSKQKKYQGIIDSQDTTNLEKKTAQMNLQQLNKFADEVFQSMEADKKESVTIPQQSFAYGGGVDGDGPSYWRFGKKSPFDIRQEEIERLSADEGLVTQGKKEFTMVPSGANASERYYNYYPNFTRETPFTPRDLSKVSIDRNKYIFPSAPQDALTYPEMLPPYAQPKSSPVVPGSPVDPYSKFTINPYQSNAFEGQNTGSSVTSTQESFDPSSMAGYIIPGMNMARGIFGKTKELDPNDYKITKKVSPLRMDVSSQLEGIDSQAATTRRNIRSGSPTQIMSGNIATSDWATRAKAGIYGNKWNVDQQSRQQSQLLDIENEKNNIQTELMIGDLNDRAKAAKDGILNTGMSQMLESYYRDRNDATIQRQLDMDSEQFNQSQELAKKISDDGIAASKYGWDAQKAISKDQMANDMGIAKLGQEKSNQSYPAGAGGGGNTTIPPKTEANSYVATELAQMALGYKGIPGDATEYERGIVSELQNNKVAMTDWAMDYILPREGGSTDPKSKSAISSTGAVGPAQLQPSAAAFAGMKIPEPILKLDKEADAAASKHQWAKANELRRQLVEETKKQWAAGWKDPRLDEKQNKEAARSILWSNYKHYGNDMRKAIAAYHQGVGTVDGLIREHGDNWDQHIGPVGKKYIKDIPKPQKEEKVYGDDLEWLQDQSKNLLIGGAAAAGLAFPAIYGTKFGRNMIFGKEDPKTGIRTPKANTGSSIGAKIGKGISKVTSSIYGTTSSQDAPKPTIKPTPPVDITPETVGDVVHSADNPAFDAAGKARVSAKSSYSTKLVGYDIEQYFDGSTVKNKKGLIQKLKSLTGASDDIAEEAVDMYTKLREEQLAGPQIAQPKPKGPTPPTPYTKNAPGSAYAKGAQLSGKQISKMIGRLGRSAKVAAPSILLDITVNWKLDKAVMQRYDIDWDKAQELKEYSGKNKITLDEAWKQLESSLKGI